MQQLNGMTSIRLHISCCFLIPLNINVPTALLLYLVAIQAVGGVAGGFRAWLFESASVRVMCRLRSRVFAAVCWQEIGFFDRVRIGELTNRLGEVR